jgi:hypothetical protein
MVFVVASSAVLSGPGPDILCVLSRATTRGKRIGSETLRIGRVDKASSQLIIQALEIQVPLAGSPIGRGHFSSSVCQPGLVQRPCCQTKISVTRLEPEDRFPSTSIST